MAVITSSHSAVSLSSNYTCTNIQHVRHYYDGESDILQDYYASSPSAASTTLTFSYSAITEPVSMAILSLTSINNTYGGSLKVSGNEVYKASGVYTIYLQPSDIDTTSTSFTLEFKTYTPSHRHLTGYDSRVHTGNTSTTDTEGNYIPVEIYTIKKYHTGMLNLDNITLKIYTGDDAANVPSTPLICVGVDEIAKKVTDMYVGVNGVAKRISDAWVGINGVARKIWPCLELKDVPVGSLIQLTEDQDGNLALYRVMGHNHYATGSTVLMREQLLTTGRFGKNTSNSDTYFGQTADTYLNTTWKATLHGPLLMKLVPTNISAQKWYAAAAGSVPTQSRQIWLPALNEVSAFESSSSGYQNESTRFSYFKTHTTTNDLIAYDASGTNQGWWTRSPVFGTKTAKVIKGGSSDPVSNREVTYTTSCWYRPVFCLPGNIPVSPINSTTYDLIL